MLSPRKKKMKTNKNNNERGMRPNMVERKTNKQIINKSSTNHYQHVAREKANEKYLHETCMRGKKKEKEKKK